MVDGEELEQYAWFYGPDECIVVAADGSFDIREALFLRHQLDLAIQDYVKAAGR